MRRLQAGIFDLEDTILYTIVGCLQYVVNTSLHVFSLHEAYDVITLGHFPKNLASDHKTGYDTNLYLSVCHTVPFIFLAEFVFTMPCHPDV